MPHIILAIGPVVFRDFELPPEIRFGGRQRLAIHRLADGRRLIDCLGRDDSSINFAGVFTGPDATLRAQTLDALRVSGSLVPLTWDAFYYSVIVQEFGAHYKTGSWIPYTLKCAVVRDETNGPLPAAIPLVEQLTDDLAAASVGGVATGIDLSLLSAEVSAPGATTYGTETYQIAQSDLASSNSALVTQLQSVSQPLQSLDFSLGSADAAISGLMSCTAIAQQAAWLARAQGYLARALVNLTCQGY